MYLNGLGRDGEIYVENSKNPALEAFYIFKNTNEKTFWYSNLLKESSLSISIIRCGTFKVARGDLNLELNNFFEKSKHYFIKAVLIKVGP